MRRIARKSGWLLVCLAASGCSEPKAPPRPIESAVISPYSGVMTIAIAPAINLSGSRDFDPLAVSDALYAELQQIQGLNVIPLNRTLYAMRQLRITSLDDAAQVQKIAQSLGAQGLIVPAVTAYDPYNPPVVGMILQMYTAPGPARPTANGAVAESDQPVSQAEAVFNATNQSVLRELRDFAQGRTQYDSALQDQKYLMDSDLYMRFVCHAMGRRLMEVERLRLAGR